MKNDKEIAQSGSGLKLNRELLLSGSHKCCTDDLSLSYLVIAVRIDVSGTVL